MLQGLEGETFDTLRRRMRDVVALSTLPAMWAGAEPLRIAESLAAALFTTINPDFVYVCFVDPAGFPIACLAQTSRYDTDPVLAESLTPRLAQWARTHDPDDLFTLEASEDGPAFYVTVRALGLEAELGVLAAGFRDDKQLQQVHHLLLNIGANQAATGVRNALLVQSLRQTEERFRSLVDASAQIVWTTGADGAVIEDSASWGAFTGQTHAERQGFGWLNAIHPEDRERTRALWYRAVSNKTPVELEYRLRHISGDWRWTAVRAVPRFDATGAVQEWVGMNIDITARKAAESMQQLLLAELNHRVKNTLANVQAIAQHTLRRAKTPTQFAEAFGGRIQSLARVHTQLTAATWQGAELKELIHDQLLQIEPDERRLRTSGPNIALDPHVALQMALVLHELGTNSWKYGALSVPEGTVAVTWGVENGTLHLQWVEEGGPPVSPPTQTGFGTILIHSSLGALGGSAQIASAETGVRWDFSLPLLAPTKASSPERTARDSGQSSAAMDTEERARVGHGPLVLMNKRVLIVEDEVMVALGIADILKGCSIIPVGPAHSVAHALRVIEGERLDAALLDANLAGAHVDEVAAALARRNVPFAFVTGYGRETLPAAFRSLLVVAKPFTSTEVITALERLLSAPAAAQGADQ